MAFDEALAVRIRQQLPQTPDISEKRMFGGLAFLWRGSMFVGINGPTLMARVGPAAYEEALRQPGVRLMDFTGKPLRGYVYVDPPAIATAECLQTWLDRCLDFVLTLPPKK